MPHVAFQFVALLLFLSQSILILPLRVGEVAGQLTKEDIAGIERVLRAGEKPWLLDADRPQSRRGQYIYAFMAATVATPELRRGTVISVERRNRSNAGQSPNLDPAWVVERTESYAQVAIAGRDFEDIQGERDINRPFRVIGRFEDSELIRSVQSLRSDPAPMPWPILSLTRKPDNKIEVQLRKNAFEGEIVWLRQAGQTWTVTVAGSWAY